MDDPSAVTKPDGGRGRVLSQPGLLATLVLFLLFAMVLASGVFQVYERSPLQAVKGALPGMQIVVGATGLFACLVLFIIGFTVNRLK
ncbi:MAG TPA: hypothetical protein VHW09_10145 [Bryobacteraceae bacterium]|nr:hypothetical protein [Bryobacteraceae bacterium]